MSRWMLCWFVFGGCVAFLCGCPVPVEPGEKGASDGGVVIDAKPPLKFTVMTFNIGTTLGLAHDQGEGTPAGDGYTKEHARITDEFYHNSLSWNPAEKALTVFLSRHKPDIVGFQEMYFDPWCEEIKVDPALDFVCKGYTKERPLQIERLLGDEYQVACAVGQEDNCIGIRRSLGRLLGCPDKGPCLDGIKGQGPKNKCSRGARVGYIEVELKDGRRLMLVLVHGTSGVKGEDQQCRKAQFAQIFVDRGDGKPAASGAANIVFGDLNTDPFLMGGADPSAKFWSEHVGPGKPFSYISSSDKEGPKTYAGTFRIDHIASDKIKGDCVVFGASKDSEPVMKAIYWDHLPVFCTVSW